MSSSYNLGNTDAITYEDGNGVQDVHRLTLDGTLIWELPFSLDIQVSSNPLMYHEYKPPSYNGHNPPANNWGSDAWNDGALIDVNPENKDFDYFLFRLKKEDGTLLRNWDSISRFRIKRDFYYNPEVSGVKYNAYILLYKYTSYSYTNNFGYSYEKPVTKGGKLLYHFVEDGGPENMSTANSAIGVSGATSGVKIWDTVRHIHANPASYRIAKSESDLTTDSTVSTHPQNRIISDYETFGLNKYFFSLRGGGSSGQQWSNTILDFSGSAVANSFGTDSRPNSATTTEQGGTWSYTVPNGVNKIEISGVGGGGGTWAAHDGNYGQNARPGGIGSGFKAIFNVSGNDVFSGNIGNAGGAGYYSGGIGGPGSATTLKKNGTLIVTANAGGNASHHAFGANGTSVKASGWDTHAESIDLYAGTHGNKILSGGDGACPACGYDAWNYVNHPDYNISDIGIPALDNVVSPRSYKLSIKGVKGGDTMFGNPYLSSKAQAAGYTLPIIEESQEVDVTITARPYDPIGGLAQVKGWIMVKELE